MVAGDRSTGHWEDRSRTSYDIIPYESHSFPQTHPDRLATIGRLFGLDSAPIDRCRVLELGCSSGGNLIPLAYHLPESRFVGIDLSRRQVEAARQLIDRLQLANIRVEHRSILDLDESIGTFDYLICHGVYSWVSSEVREKILHIASRQLTPNAIAYVSYNTYPGWRMREMIRDMMMFHADRFDEPKERIQQARALMDFLTGAVAAADSPYSLLLRSELELIRRSRDWYLFHDHLEEINRPSYFHQFMDAADKHDLQYLGEAEFSTMLDHGFGEDVRETLERISPDIIHKEQYMDFIRQRSFRQTLLCSKSHALKRNLDATSIAGLWSASSAEPTEAPIDLTPAVVAGFRTLEGRVVRTGSALTKAALAILGEHWPRALSVDELFKRASERITEAGCTDPLATPPDPEVLAADLIWCGASDIVEFHSWQAPFTTLPGSRPKVSPLAATLQSQSLPVVNCRHQTVEIDPIARHLFPLLDGCHDHPSLVTHLVESINKGELSLQADDEETLDPAAIRAAMSDALQRTLTGLARTALLEE